MVRRLRLGVAVRELRRQAGMTHEQLAAKARLPRTDISRLETGARKPDVGKVMTFLDALGSGEGSETWRTMIRLAREASEKGWWDGAEFSGMSERQKRCADVESGARWIALYQNSLIPGLVQTPEFIAARDRALLDDGIAVDSAQGAARSRRQRELIRDGGPAIDIVLEEQVVRRRVVDPKTMADQLRHLVGLAGRFPQISIRVLPVECTFTRGHVPRSPLALHTFADEADGTALLVETVDDDMLIYDQREVASYVRLWDRLRDAALSDADSAAFIEKTAADLVAS